ncbi:hypothetical protein BSKO_00004 [Bryopsis sp. KO-2023]|nr:hypothetical protein BSKO_00004 [Bryopsis sp. KO-2023]
MAQMNFDQENALMEVAGEMSVALTPEEEADCQLDSPAFLTDDFRVNSFKVVPCSKRFSHDWTTCPFAHPGEKARRRDPNQCKYAAIACIDMKNTNFCPRGEECPYAHNVFEYWMHPTRYRTQMCNDGMNCRRKICFFAHKKDEIRTPPHKPGFPSEWQKGKKHSRSRSSGANSARASKPTSSPKCGLSSRTHSGPLDIKKPVEVSDPQELFKSKSFSSGQFAVPENIYLRRSLEFMAQQGSGLPMSETWDMESNVPSLASINPPVHIGSQPLSAPWTSPRQPRRSFDIPQTEPTIPENEVPLMPPARRSSDVEVACLIQQLMMRAGYGDASPFNLAPTEGNLQNLMGCLPGSDSLPSRASFDSQSGQNLTAVGSGVSLGVPETVTGMPDSYGSPQRVVADRFGNGPQQMLGGDYGSPEHGVPDNFGCAQQLMQDFNPYPMMGSHDLVNSMGALSIGNNLTSGAGPVGSYIMPHDCTSADVTSTAGLHIPF